MTADTGIDTEFLNPALWYTTGRIIRKIIFVKVSNIQHMIAKAMCNETFFILCGTSLAMIAVCVIPTNIPIVRLNVVPIVCGR